MDVKEKQAFSKAEFAKQFSVSADSVNRAIQRGDLKVIRFGRRVLIPRSEVERVLETGVRNEC